MDPSKPHYWQDLCRPEKVNKIINDGFFADCKFVVGPEDETAETIHGHKIFYIMESPVFEKMFSGNYVEAEGKSEIRLTDVLPHDFRNLSYMIYTSSTANLEKLSLEEILALYRLCDKYMISSILISCINHTKNPNYLNQISIDDLITVFEFARDLEDKSLLQVTRKVIQSRCRTTLYSRTDSLSEESFYDYVRTLSESPLEFISKAATTELYIFSVVNSYFVKNNLMDIINDDKQAGDNLEHKHNSKKLKHDESSKICELSPKTRIKNLLQNLLNLIKFNLINVKDFRQGPGLSIILDDKQKYYLISCLIDKCKCKYSYNSTQCQCIGPNITIKL